MKKLTTTLLLLFVVVSNYTFANWVKQSDIANETISTVYMKKSSCGSDCLKLPNGFNANFHKLFDVMMDDISNPNHELKSDVVLCSAIVDDPETTEIDETKTQMQDCLEKESAQVCGVSDSVHPYFVVRVADNSEVYCTRIVSYAQIPSGVKEVREDPTLKVAYDASEVARLADENLMNLALKAMNCGKRVKARLLVRNSPKSLNNGQKKQIVSLYKDIQSLLEAGSLEAAKEEINLVTPDGTLITSSDLTALVNELDSCK